MKRNNYLDKHILRLYELRTKLLVWGKCHHHQMWGSPHICSPHLFMHQFLSATHKSSSFTCFTAPFPISQDFKKNNTSGENLQTSKKKVQKHALTHPLQKWKKNFAFSFMFAVKFLQKTCTHHPSSHHFSKGTFLQLQNPSHGFNCKHATLNPPGTTMSSGHARKHRGSGFMHPQRWGDRHQVAGGKYAAGMRFLTFLQNAVGCMEDFWCLFDTCWLEKFFKNGCGRSIFLTFRRRWPEKIASQLFASLGKLWCLSCRAFLVCQSVHHSCYQLRCRIHEWLIHETVCNPSADSIPQKTKSQAVAATEIWQLILLGTLYITKGISIASMPKIDSQEPKLCQQLPRSSLPRRTELVNSLSYPTIYPPRERSDIPPPGSSESHLD